jgi:hypothetical protein
MFRSLPDHHQGVHAFLVEVTELKCEYSCVVMRQQCQDGIAEQLHPDSALKRSSKTCMKLTNAECTVENS